MARALRFTNSKIDQRKKRKADKKAD